MQKELGNMFEPFIKSYKWIVSNIWNLFGPIGIISSLYFSVFYVPDYVKEISNSKSRIMHESIMNDVEEFIFHNKEINSENIESFIRGKELKYGIDYNYSIKDVLLQVQNNFVTNKYIPLERRDEIVKSISKIKIEEKPKAKINFYTYLINYLPFILSILGIVISVFGVISIAYKYRKDKETNIDIASMEAHEDDLEISGNATYSAYEYEKSVQIALKEIGVKYKQDTKIFCTDREYPIDFIVYYQDKEIIIEIKDYRKLMGVGTASRLVNKLARCKKQGILVISTGLTKRTTDMINKHNKLNPESSLFVVSGLTKSSLTSGIMEALKQSKHLTNLSTATP